MNERPVMRFCLPSNPRESICLLMRGVPETHTWVELANDQGLVIDGWQAGGYGKGHAIVGEVGIHAAA